MEFVEDDARLLAECPALHLLVLSGSGIDDESLAHAARLTQLRSLHLYGCAVTDDGFAPFEKMEHLEHLAIRGILGIDGSGTKHLANLQRLEVLSLGACRNVTDVCIPHVSAIPNLRTVALPSVSLQDRVRERMRRRSARDAAAP